MDIQGKVIKLLDSVEYTSKRTGEKDFKYGFVIETQGQYPQKIAFSVFGKEKYSHWGIAPGGIYSVSFDISSREWNGKWFTEATAFNVVRVDYQPQQSVQAKPQEAPQPNPIGTQGENKDDLSF